MKFTIVPNARAARHVRKTNANALMKILGQRPLSRFYANQVSVPIKGIQQDPVTGILIAKHPVANQELAAFQKFARQVLSAKRVDNSVAA